MTDPTRREPRRARPRRRAVAGVAAIACAAAVLVAPVLTGAAVATPKPPNPTDNQINAAAAAKTALADQVGSLAGQVTSLQTQISQLNLKAELAEQKLADALSKLAQAKVVAATAQQQVATAQAQVTAAHTQFVRYVQAVYMSGSVGGAAGSLLTSQDPSALLQAGDYQQFAETNQIGALADLRRATVAKSNADAAARGAVQNQTTLTEAAQQAQAAAADALSAARSRQQQLQAVLASTQSQLGAAQEKLATLNNQRRTYLAYVAEQERIAAAKRAAAAAAAAAAARAAAARAAAAAAANNDSGGGGGGGGGTPSTPTVSTPSSPQGGGWTAAKGQQAVDRAMQYLNWPYSYAAGNYYGPTYGVAVDYDSRNDGSVYGFDCSGLSMFAWGPYIHMDHYAATQYDQAGSFHPDIGSLLPGDLVFWSEDGTVSGIGHVAIYVGNGNVIQAPYSGAYIEITPVYQVESGLFGATRPLT